MLLSPKRLSERAGILAALLGVVGLDCGVTIGVLGLISAAATDRVRIGLAERSGMDIAYRVSFRLAEDLASVVADAVRPVAGRWGSDRRDQGGGRFISALED